DHRIRRTVDRLVRRNLSWIRHTALARLRPRLPLPLIVGVEERLIFDDRTTQRPAKLVVVERVRRSRCVEEIAGPPDRTGAVELQRRSMPLVRPALGHD